MNKYDQKNLLPSVEALGKSLVDFFYPFLEVSIIGESGKILSRFNPLPTNEGHFRSQEISFGEFTLQLRHDLSFFHDLRGHLDRFLDIYKEKVQEGPIGEQQIIGWINTYLKEHHLTPEGASKEQKRQLIHYLHEKGAFSYKEASKVIASTLKLSRASVYNYLNTAITLSGIPIHQVDAFTDQRFKGNPAGVVLDADTLSPSLMQKIAREMNLSETAFVLSSEKGDFRLRYFTPTGDEVVFCGHSTVGALYMLAHEERLGMNKPGIYTFKVETNAGLLKVEMEKKKGDKILVRFETPPIKMQKAPFSQEEVCEALGLSPKALRHDLPLYIEKTNQDLFIPLKSLKDLEKFSIELKKAEVFARQNNLVTFCLFTDETVDTKHDIHMRCFAPAVGIPEDPFTGSVLGGLAAYIYEQKFLENPAEFSVEQGHFIKRPGHVKVLFSAKKSSYSAWIEAQAVHLFSTRISLR